MLKVNGEVRIYYSWCVASECCEKERMRMYWQICGSMAFKTATLTCWWQMLLGMCGEKGNYLTPSSQTVCTVCIICIQLLTGCYLQLLMGSGKGDGNLDRKKIRPLSHLNCKILVLNQLCYILFLCIPCTYFSFSAEWIVTYQPCAAITFLTC